MTSLFTLKTDFDGDYDDHDNGNDEEDDDDYEDDDEDEDDDLSIWSEPKPVHALVAHNGGGGITMNRYG